MGIEFAIAKRHPRQTYYLGKPTLEVREPPSKPPSRKPPKGDDARIAWITKAVLYGSPSFVAMWSIMGNPNYVTFTLDASMRDELADKLWRGAMDISTRAQADIVADDILAWAGNADLILVTDGDHGPVEHLGYADAGYRETGSIRKALKAAAA